MLQKNYAVSIPLAIALIAFAYAAITFVQSYEKTIEPSNFRSFNVTAEGSVVAVPDIATFSFTVITEGGSDLAALQQENAQKNDAIYAFLEAQEIDKKDLKTTSYNVSPRYEQCYAYQQPGGVCPPPKIVGYTVSQSTLVKIRDFESIGATLAGVVDQGANSVSQLSFTIDDQTSVKEEARAEAIEKAKEKAKQIASDAGFSIGKLLDITEGYSYPYQTRYGYETAALDYAEASYTPTIEAGSQDVTVTVTMTYEIK
jgi:uncharacterized protein YggE